MAKKKLDKFSGENKIEFSDEKVSEIIKNFVANAVIWYMNEFKKEYLRTAYSDHVRKAEGLLFAWDRFEEASNEFDSDVLNESRKK